MTNPDPNFNTEYVASVICTNPINTPATDPVVTPVGIDTAWVWRVEILIPAGHAGYTGIALVDSGAFIVPYANPGPAWFIGDNNLLEYNYDKQTGVNLAFWSYNTSTDYTHSFYCRVVYTPIGALEEGGSAITSPDLSTWLAEIGSESG